MHRSVYRSLLRNARRVDGDPALRTLLCVPSPFSRRYDHKSERWVEWDVHDTDLSPSPVIEFLRSVNGGRTFYAPSDEACRKISPSIREAFRNQRAIPSRNLAAAFTGLRVLQGIVAASPDIAVGPVTDSVEEYLAGATASPLQDVAHEVVEGKGGRRKKKGTTIVLKSAGNKCAQFLVAHPLLDRYYRHSLVLVSSHKESSDAESGASMGWIVNQPLITLERKTVTVSLMRQYSASGFDHAVYATLQDNIVFCGGPVASPTSFSHIDHAVFLLYCGKDGGSLGVEVVPGVYNVRDLDALNNAITTKVVKSSDIMVVVGYCGWGLGQLTGEVGQRSWFPVTLSGEENIIAAMLAAQREAANYAEHSMQSRIPQWRQFLCAMGGEYREMTRLTAIMVDPTGGHEE